MPAGSTVSMWRDPAPQVLAERPDLLIAHGVTVDGDAVSVARSHFDEGVRLVQFDQTVDMSDDPERVVRALTFIREYTSHGIAVHWRLDAAGLQAWRSLGHLYPPTDLTGTGGEDAAALEQWSSAYRICKLFYRRGPGFIHIRDHRSGQLRQFTIRGVRHIGAIDQLLGGAPEADVPRNVAADFEKVQLLGRVGDMLWWLPYRVHRWPLPAAMG